MSIKDVIKSGVYEKFVGQTGISFFGICAILLMACLIGVYIFFVYKNFTRSEFYSKDLNITIAGMTIVVAAIMIAMQSNLLVSLGMVGALSIVRFRTAVKNPMDLLYLFWAISGGIICGVGLYVLAAVLCIIMTITIFVLGKVPNSKAPAIVVIRTDLTVPITDLEKMVKENSKCCKEKSVVVKNGEREIIYEIRSASQDSLISRLEQNNGVHSINWLEHHGEMRI